MTPVSIKVSTSDVLSMAWEQYRKNTAGMDLPFNRKLFAGYLESSWAACRAIANQARREAEAERDVHPRIAAIQEEIARLPYAPWGVDIRAKESGLRAELATVIDEVWAYQQAAE